MLTMQSKARSASGKADSRLDWRNCAPRLADRANPWIFLRAWASMCAAVSSPST